MADQIQALVAELHNHAESTHCASAILGTQHWLALRNKRKWEAQVNAMTEQLLEATIDLDFEKMDDILNKIEDIKKKPLNFTQLDIRYSAHLPKESGRALVVDDYYPIILPKDLQDSIINELEKCPAEWTSNMKDAKIALRKRTLHEIAHILLQLTNENDPSDQVKHEKDVQYFTELFYAQREERNALVNNN